MEMLSLYDFLGKAAGGDIGREVYAAAQKGKIKVESKQIQNPKYEGKVLLYPRDFLEFHFREPKHEK